MGRAVVTLGAVILASAVASAQPQPNDAQKKQAGDLVKKAIAKSKDGDHAAAIELYLQAYAIVPQPLLLSNIASEYQQEGKLTDAVKYFCKYLDEDPHGGNAQYATQQAKQARAAMGEKVEDADVCKPIEKPVPAVGSGSAGSGSAGSGSAIVEPPKPVVPPPPAPNHTLEYAGFGVAGAGAIALTIGIVYGLKGKSLSDQINGHPSGTPWPTTIDGIPINQWDSAGKDYNKKQIAWTIIGGTVLAAGGVMAYLGYKKSHEEQISVAPSVAPGAVGVVIGGGF